MTYELSANDMPILRIILIVCILHQMVVFQDRDPVLVLRHVFSRITAICRCDELLDSDRVSVEILQGQVAKEGDLVILVECHVDVVLAGALLLRRHFVRDSRVCLLDRILILRHHVTQASVQIHSALSFLSVKENMFTVKYL